MTVLDILTNAHIEIGALATGEVLQPGDTNYSLSKFNDLMDEWSAREVFAFAMNFTAFTLTAGHGPTLIGPGLVAPDFAATIRPVRIEGCTIILNTSPTNIDSPVNHQRDAAWWNYQRVKTLQSNIPTDLYYEPDFPNGQLNFWPVPNFNYGVRLQTWVPLPANVSVSTIIALPPGYQKAITLTLAMELCPSLGMTPNPVLVNSQKLALKAIQGNNALSPRMSTVDSGMPITQRHRRGGFNWLTGDLT